MSWRKWLVRGLVFGIVGAVACAGLLYQRWTNPIAIRQQVLDKLRELFPGATVTLDSAHLELLGGIRFSELYLVRRDDPDRTEIAYVPSGVLYHNKEEVLDGKLSFRKIVLERLRLRVARNREGHWNLAGIAAPTAPGKPLPTVVVHQATLVIEDQLPTTGPKKGSDAAAEQVSLEIHNAALRLLNDPLSTVLIEGTGISDTVGALELHAAWQRDSHELSLQAKALGIPLAPVFGRLAPYCNDGPLGGLQIAGKADIETEIVYRPQYPRPLAYDVRCQLNQVTLKHPQLPLPLANLDASLRCTNGALTVERLTARAGPAAVELHGSTVLPDVAQEVEGALTIKHLAVCEELCNRLPDDFQKLYQMFQPRGPVTVNLQGTRHGGRWEQMHCVLEPESVGVCYNRFPYPLDGLAGIIDCDLLKKVHNINLSAYAGKQPVHLRGTWAGSGKDADVRLEIQADGIVIDDRLLSVLPKKPVDLQKLAQSFHPRGRGDIRAVVRHAPGSATFANEYQVQFHDAALRWSEFPYPLEGVSGLLEVHPDYWEFSRFQGSHNGATVRVHGRSYPGRLTSAPITLPSLPGGGGRGQSEGGAGQEVPMAIVIEGENVNLDADLRAALEVERVRSLGKAWDTFAPAGRMNFAAHIDRSPGQSQDLDVAVDVHGCEVEPRFFRYALSDLSGHFRFAHNRLTVSKVSARHNGSRIRLGEGTVDLAPGSSGFHADLADLEAYPLFPEADLLQAVPSELKSFLEALKLQDPVVLKTRLVVSQDGESVSPPMIYWDGQLWLRDARLQTGVELEHVTGTAACRGCYDGRRLQGLSGNVLLDQASCFKQPFRNVHAQVLIANKAPDVLILGLKAPLYGGEISGEGRMELGYSTLRYELNLTASQIALEEFGAQNLGPEPKLSGQAQGRLFLSGRGSGLDSLEGQGQIDVPDGKLIRLPFLLELLKFLNLRWPDRTAFQELHAAFGIHGKRVTLDQLNLLGNPVSLSGNGGVNLDGTDLQMNFYPTWGRSEQLLPPVVRTVPATISKNLLQIEVRGKVGSQPGDLQFTKKLVPALSGFWQKSSSRPPAAADER
jgi:hypothetical protein